MATETIKEAHKALDAGRQTVKEPAGSSSGPLDSGPVVRGSSEEAQCQRGRGRPRDEEARGRILASALRLLEELSFGSVTMDAIAELAGASKATIYRWWPNKAAVLVEALREDVAQEIPFPRTGSLREDVHQQLRNFVKLLTGQRGRIFRAFISAAQNDPEVASAFRSVWMQHRRVDAKAVLQWHQEQGSLAADADLDLILDALYGPLYFRLLAGHAPLTEEYADQIAELILAGIVRPE